MRFARSMASALLATGALALAACGGVGSPSSPTALKKAAADLTGRWRLVSLQESGKPEVAIAQPEGFTVEFGPDGRLAVKADCNRCTAAYTAGAQDLSVGLMACTRAACGSAPLDNTFTGLVSSSSTWSIPADSLQLRSASGTLRFRR
jgi:heat shock protein HslJ